tara:strand:+ start:674 stop:937 length:264 start_codon:yes stop_codon:yes gene_type:complete
MSDLNSIQAASLASELTLAKNNSTRSINIATSVKSDVQQLKRENQILRRNINNLIVKLATVESLRGLNLEDLKMSPADAAPGIAPRI